MRAIDIQHRREAMSSCGRRVRGLRLLLGLRVEELVPAGGEGYQGYHGYLGYLGYTMLQSNQMFCDFSSVVSPSCSNYEW